MRRIKDSYLEAIQTQVSFSGRKVLEIGCGIGTRTSQISQIASHVTAIDPDDANIVQAMLSSSSNVEFLVGSAESLPFVAEDFDIVFFTLSFHHVPGHLMNAALDEAIRVVRRDGYIIFLEPAFTGSFFESELMFDACDGDERLVKSRAYAAMLEHHGLKEVCELFDETIFTFESVDDFMEFMHPRRRIDQLEPFLRDHQFTLHAARRINIFRPL